MAGGTSWHRVRRPRIHSNSPAHQPGCCIATQPLCAPLKAAVERKSVIMVRWKNTGKWQAYSSLVAFCSRNAAYTTDYIYNRWKAGVYGDYRLELRRVPFVMNKMKTRRGGVRREKPGPTGPRTVKR